MAAAATATGLMAMLEEQDMDLRRHALKSLNQVLVTLVDSPRGPGSGPSPSLLMGLSSLQRCKGREREVFVLESCFGEI